MLKISGSKSNRNGRSHRSAPELDQAGRLIRRFHPSETIFCRDEPKAYNYRVESGAIGITWTPQGAVPEPIEVLSAGALFGTGLFHEHVYDAIALVETRVSCWPRDDMSGLASYAEDLSQRQADETEREFIHRRRMVTASRPRQPFQRVAAFLIAMAQLNRSEGRDPSLIDSEMESGAAAALLQIDMNTLAGALVQLRKHGAIAPDPAGNLLIRDLAALERLASGR